MWVILANLIAGPVVNGVVSAYKAKLDAGNTEDRIASDLAARYLELQARERELATQITLREEGRWWTAAPRAIVTWAAALYVGKVVVVDTMLGLGSTPALKGDIAVWMGWIMGVWFGGRSLEKVAGTIAGALKR